MLLRASLRSGPTTQVSGLYGWHILIKLSEYVHFNQLLSSFAIPSAQEMDNLLVLLDVPSQPFMGKMQNKTQ